MAPDPALASMRKIATRADVYPPAEDSFLLVDALAEIWRDELATARPRLCVEIGTGSGYVACSCALLAVKHGCGGWTRTRASDVNPSAVEACRETCAAHGVDEEACATARGDLLTPHEEAIAANGGCDVLLFNPPYVVTPSEEIYDPSSLTTTKREGEEGTTTASYRPAITAAWAGGLRGREVLDRILGDIKSWLRPNGGTFLVVAYAQNDVEEMISILQNQGLEVEIAKRTQADEESLVVIKAVRL